MRARVPEKYPHVVVTACAGVRFNKVEWIPVPLGREDEARQYEAGNYLELKEEPVEPEAVDANALDLMGLNPSDYNLGDLEDILEHLPEYSYPVLSEMLIKELGDKNRKGAVDMIQASIDKDQTGSE